MRAEEIISQALSWAKSGSWFYILQNPVRFRQAGKSVIYYTHATYLKAPENNRRILTLAKLGNEVYEVK